MANRTNKMGILKKKTQQAKQKKIGIITKNNLEGIKKEYENPNGNKYTRFFRSGKWVNDSTSVREDPDGYRILRKANAGEIEFILKGEDSFGFRKWKKKLKTIKFNRNKN